MTTKHSTKKKRGRKPIEITPALCKRAEKLAAGGRTEKQIAISLGFCNDTLIEKKKKYPEFSEAIKKGKAKAISVVENMLFEEASDGNTTAMIFFLKNRNHEYWKDRHEVEHSGDVTLSDAVKKARERVSKSTEQSD